jgi:hypothetical protein
VVIGALQTVQGQEREQKQMPTEDIGATVKGHPEATIEQMKQAYRIMKENNFDRMKLPLHLLQSPDHALSESPMNRDPKATTYAIPSDEAHAELAMYTGLYYRRNFKKLGNRSVAHPSGYFLVMFRDGRLVKVAGKDVRLIPAPQIEPTAQELSFPGMKRYRTDLPRLPEFQSPWYAGPPLD